MAVCSSVADSEVSFVRVGIDCVVVSELDVVSLSETVSPNVRVTDDSSVLDLVSLSVSVRLATSDMDGVKDIEELLEWVGRTLLLSDETCVMDAEGRERDALTLRLEFFEMVSDSDSVGSGGNVFDVRESVQDRVSERDSDALSEGVGVLDRERVKDDVLVWVEVRVAERDSDGVFDNVGVAVKDCVAVGVPGDMLAVARGCGVRELRVCVSEFERVNVSGGVSVVGETLRLLDLDWVKGRVTEVADREPLPEGVGVGAGVTVAVCVVLCSLRVDDGEPLVLDVDLVKERVWLSLADTVDCERVNESLGEERDRTKLPDRLDVDVGVAALLPCNKIHREMRRTANEMQSRDITREERGDYLSKFVNI